MSGPLPILAAATTHWTLYVIFTGVLLVFFTIVHVLHRRAHHYFAAGRWDDALRYYEYTWFLFGFASKRDVRPLFNYNLAKINAARARPLRAIDYYATARRIALEVDNPLIVALACIEIGRLLAKLNRWEESVEAYQQARELSEAHPKKPYLLKILFAMAEAWEEQGDLETAEKLLREGLRIASNRSDAAAGVKIWVALGRMQYDQGQWQSARQNFDAALELAKEQSYKGRTYALARIWSGRLHHQRGAWEQARKDLHEAMQIGRATKDKSALFAASLEMGRLALDKGQTDNAIETLKKTLQWARELKEPRQQAMALQALGAAYQRAKDQQQAFLHFQKAGVLLKRNYMPRVECMVLAGLAIYYNERGDHGQARQTLHQAEKLAKQGGAQFELISIYDAFAAMYREAEKPDLAKAYRQKSHKLRQQLGIQARLVELSIDLPGQ